MKKILIIAVILAAAGCAPLDRSNPTDPLSPEYTGWHLIREIGDFTLLADFCVSGSSLYCADVQTEAVYSYDFSGNSNFYTIPMFTLPTGICADGIYIFVADHHDTFEIKWLDESVPASNQSVDVEKGGDKIATDNAYLYVAESDPPGVYTYLTETVVAASAQVPYESYWPLTIGADAGEFMYISDIEYSHNAGRVLIADSGTDRISVFTPSGVFERHIIPGGGLSGIAVYGNTVFVPNETGIHFIDFNSGNIIKTIADYGEGAGKVTKPGLIEVSGDNIFYSAGGAIKYFAP